MTEKKAVSRPPRRLGPKPEPDKTSRISFWIGIITSVTTVALAVYTGFNKARIDGLEAKLNDRHETVEESTERVERYKWVFSMYKDLTDADQRKSKFTAGLITLALSDSESTKLFSALRSSSDTVLQKLGTNGFATVENSRIAALVAKVDTSSAGDRINAVGELEKNYASSNYAITLILDLYNPDNISRMSGNGLINGLYYLNSTNITAWNPQQIKRGKEIYDRLVLLKPGDKTTAELTKFKAKISAPGAN